MDSQLGPWSNSDWTAEGEIPDTGGIPAFVYRASGPSSIPILVAVPHAGRCYPDSLLRMIRNPGVSTLRLEDRYADLVAQGVADQTGAVIVKALAPRALIDLNRAPEDIDWSMIGPGVGPGRFPQIRSQAPSRRARSGLGLIPRRLPGQEDLWRSKLDPAALAERLDQVHGPYHACLRRLLDQIARRWGAAMLVDLHSMPTITHGAARGATIVMGDRFGASCDARLAQSASRYLSEREIRHAHNLPYAGGHVLELHADPLRGIHAIQLEVDRAAYLDQDLREPGPGLEPMIRLISGLVKTIAGEVADLGHRKLDQRYPEAAE